MDKAIGFALRTALVGLVLGLLGGILGGVEFGVILLRMLISALIAGALGAGAYFVVQKFLPELFSLSVNADEDNPLDPGLGGDLSTAGSNVNIVVDDESGPIPQNINDQAEALRDEVASSPGANSSPEMAPRGAVSESETVQNLFVEDENTIIEEVREDAAVSPRGSDDPAPQEQSFESDVSSLPDISSLSDSFNDGNFADEGEVPEGEMAADSDEGSALYGFGAQETSFDSGGKSDSDDDPKIMAKAIQTLMKKSD
jgi:hypothetical protein